MFQEALQEAKVTNPTEELEDPRVKLAQKAGVVIKAEAAGEAAASLSSLDPALVSILTKNNMSACVHLIEEAGVVTVDDLFMFEDDELETAVRLNLLHCKKVTKLKEDAAAAKVEQEEANAELAKHKQRQAAEVTGGAAEEEEPPTRQSSAAVRAPAIPRGAAPS